jgi:D-lactate dehydrogenase
MKVAWFDAEDWHEDYIDSSHEIHFFQKSLDTGELDGSYDAISVFVDSEVDGEVIRKVRPDKILCRSSGFDNVDMEAADEYGATVYNVPDYGSETVAEYAFALILSRAKRLTEDLGKNPNRDEGVKGSELKGKKLGVIGAGKIGREVIRRAKSFEMKVLAYDPFEDEKAAEKLGYSYGKLEEVLKTSDIVTVHCPLNESTEHLISGDEVSCMEDTLLVNTARGAVIDSRALYEGLQNGSVSYAALDVVEDGWYEKLSDLENTYITPHNAYNTREAEERMVDRTLMNLNGQKESIDS